MTAGQRTRRISNVSMAPAALAALLGATLLGGAMAGAAVTARIGSIETSPAAIPVVEAPQPGPGAISLERRDRLGGP